MVSLPDSWKLF